MKILLLCMSAAGAVMGLSEANVRERPVYYVSPGGSDSSSGSEMRPFRSPARARDAARDRGGATVVLADGTYELSEPLVFTSADSNLIFKAAQGAVPVLSAGRRVSDWRVDAKGWWHAKLPAGTKVSQFYVNGRRRMRPFLPRSGYYFIGAEAGPSPEGLQRFVSAPGHIDPSWDLSGIEVCVFHTWSMSRMPIRSFDAGTRMVTLAHPAMTRPGIARMAPDNWYRLENVREALGQPGDWYLSCDGELTYVPMPCCERPESAECVAAVLPHVVTGSRTSDITFRGVVFAHAAWNVPSSGHYCDQAAVDVPGAVDFEHSRNIRLENCAVLRTGGYAVSFTRGDRDCAVVGCELVDLGAGGVKIGCAWNGDEDEGNHGSGCTVEECLIRGGGRVDPSGVGVFIGHAHHNRVSHNTICDLHYSGVSAGWNWSFDETAHDNVIEANHIYDIGQGVLSDMGGIYLLGRQKGTVERFNRIHGVTRARNCGFGIYFDSGSSCVSVTNNLVYDCQDSNLFLASLSASNRVENNIFANAAVYQLNAAVRNEKSCISRFARNIVWWTSGRFMSVVPPEDTMDFVDNILWCPNAGRRAGEVRGFVWRDPGFIDPENGNFAFSNEADVRSLGFVPFSVADAGRRLPLALTEERQVVTRTFPPAPEPPVIPCHEDFENAGGSDVWLGWDRYPTGDCSAWARVTDATAAQGRKSLEILDFRDDYAPHFCAWPVRSYGKVRVSFWLRIERGAQPAFEVRDVDAWLGAPGPIVFVDGEGCLRCRDSEPLLTLPTEEWLMVELAFRVGKTRQEHVYAVRVKLPGEAVPRDLGEFPLHPDFLCAGWFGFMSNGMVGSRYWIDDFSIRP